MQLCIGSTVEGPSTDSEHLRKQTIANVCKHEAFLADKEQSGCLKFGRISLGYGIVAST